jgi:hypothetical protein
MLSGQALSLNIRHKSERQPVRVLCNSTPLSMHAGKAHNHPRGAEEDTAMYQASIHIGSLQMLEETDTRKTAQMLRA